MFCIQRFKLSSTGTIISLNIINIYTEKLIVTENNEQVQFQNIDNTMW